MQTDIPSVHALPTTTRGPTILVYDSDVVVALDPDGRLPVKAWLVGNELKQGAWPREELVKAAEEAGLPPETITGGRLTKLTEFQRACRSIEHTDEFGPSHILLRLPNGREVQVNAHVSLEVKSVDGTRVGSVYQLNRRIKYYVKDIEPVLAEGITMDMVMEALSAKDASDHEITQNIGKWVLEDDHTIRAVVYEEMTDDPTGAAFCFSRQTHLVRKAFAEMAGLYTHHDLRLAWMRNWRAMTGSFPIKLGAGGITCVPVAFKPQLDCWKRFFERIYGAEARFSLLPATNVGEVQELIQRDGEEWLQKEWDALIEQTLTSLRKASREREGEKLDRACERVTRNLKKNMDELREAEAAINKALEERFQVRASASSSRLAQLRHDIDDPRIRGVFLTAGVIEDEEATFPLPEAPPTLDEGLKTEPFGEPKETAPAHVGGLIEDHEG